MTENQETRVAETVDIQTEAVTTPAIAEPAATDLTKVRELVLKAHPDVVPDLVRGSSVDELIASVDPARSAYQRIADQVRRTESSVVSRESEVSPDSTAAQPPVVPAGGAASVVDPADLTPTSKIAQALAARRTKSGSR
jgi:hypothetical protein